MSDKVCRLCGQSETAKLFNIFAPNASSENITLSYKIQACYGVQIREEDEISKQICRSCFFFTNSVYEYRVSALEHDSKLWTQFKQTQRQEQQTIENPEISNENHFNLISTDKSTTIELEPEPEPEPVLPMHTSVQELKRKYPNIILPITWYQYNFEPTLVLNRVAKSDPDLNSNLNLNLDLDSKSKRLKSIKIKPLDRKRKRVVNGRRVGVVGGNVEEQQKICKKPNKTKSFPNNDDFDDDDNDIDDDNDNDYNDNNDNVDDSEFQSTIVTRTKSRLNNGVEVNKYQKLDVTLQPFRGKQLPEKQINEPTETVKNEPEEDQSFDLLVSIGDEVRTYICQTCNKIFDTLTTLRNHKKNYHKCTLRCFQCSELFSSVEKLIIHNKTHPTVDSNELNQVLEERIETEEKVVVMNSTVEAAPDVFGSLLNNAVNETRASLPEPVPESEPDRDLKKLYFISSDEEDNNTEMDVQSDCISTTTLKLQESSSTIKEDIILQSQIVSVNDNKIVIDDSDTEIETIPNKISQELSEIVIEDSDNENDSTLTPSTKEIQLQSNEMYENMSLDDKTENEQTYLDNVFKKLTSQNGSETNFDLKKKWLLRNFKKISRYSVPIELQKSNISDVLVDYGPGPMTAVPTNNKILNVFWDSNQAIHIPNSAVSVPISTTLTKTTNVCQQSIRIHSKNTSSPISIVSPSLNMNLNPNPNPNSSYVNGNQSMIIAKKTDLLQPNRSVLRNNLLTTTVTNTTQIIEQRQQPQMQSNLPTGILYKLMNPTQLTSTSQNQQFTSLNNSFCYSYYNSEQQQRQRQTTPLTLPALPAPPVPQVPPQVTVPVPVPVSVPVPVPVQSQDQQQPITNYMIVNPNITLNPATLIITAPTNTNPVETLPSIRIKNLSQLIDKNVLNLEQQQNQFNGSYENTFINYVRNQ